MNKFVRLNYCIFPKEDIRAIGLSPEDGTIKVHYRYDDEPITINVDSERQAFDILADIHRQLEDQ